MIRNVSFHDKHYFSSRLKIFFFMKRNSRTASSEYCRSMTTLSIRPPLASKKPLTGPATTLFYTPFYSRKHIKTLFSCFFIFVMI